ncbi:MAG: hypothetical protein J0I07_33550, partial [Myxococcales bacterium]|nr:hypothetical protein [Myxococcales bacterium]
KKAWIAVIAATASLGVIVACSGSSDVDILGAGSSSSGSSGSSGSNGSSGSSGEDGAGACPPCPAPPDPACKGTGACNCGPWVCPDAGSDPVDAGSDAGGACTWSAGSNPCGPGMYCAAKNCKQGTCVAVGTNESSNRNPVCGCDGVTYWNESVAAKNGMSIAKGGACGNDGAICNGIVPCPNGSKCNRRLQGADGCLGGNAQGSCWMTPSTCPGVLVGTKSRACGALTCNDECNLIKAGSTWYVDGLCPQ